MNVLILTPDAVGSTLLQRLITIYMQFHAFDKPVINLHELTNGLIKYYSPEFNRELLGKSRDLNAHRGYYQSLDDIISLLESVDHYKTSRLAQYHIRNRNDPIEKQIPFYRYLDENFYVISCRRKNIFEHALAWGLTKSYRRLNFYDHDHKIETLLQLYIKPVEVDVIGFENQLEGYADYISWCDHFTVSSYFIYEDHIPNIENYILKLPIFPTPSRQLTWNSVFGMSFDDWNHMHYFRSDIGSLALSSPEKLKQLSIEIGKKDNSITDVKSNMVYSNLNHKRQQFISNNIHLYETIDVSIKKMVELGIIPSSLPIKRQTLREKQLLIKNFDRCLEIYNDWILSNQNLGQPIDPRDLESMINNEKGFWDNYSTSKINTLL